ncbi:Conserved hypothetical protein [Clostridium acetobutylicum EA 2018]|uniref:Uncharacterized protein n=1 Tax=Clostridium acetobutylicum (strain ATCC 824 / DSM 792 / JCM 1419 / IAM 19013 / LMG 5710 / NBRC 13948 / NRRL B-527 / VKM B-1787 / 2291 / W) TaxID=272562 RepID=Q97JS0_CLOAB|nr:Hypothetical protein CA_C1203 [Clostridium acetobutylicum ATCC 824]ADZ20253.1 Conserved hypothetical protein [Clostridium acetobutylicum EA 2018]AEI31707.1 hypothetical protein SMB_G1223 [Clostridium acetobutylicum DSM 1731]AWV81574.1 hypothetical protein DK921_16035 [Clostridium acetobutylicum]PSM04859.1 hypothetical protein C7T89_16030 [Clostridium sp. NJ4]
MSGKIKQIENLTKLYSDNLNYKLEKISDSLYKMENDLRYKGGNGNGKDN